EASALRRRHAHFFLEVAETAAAQLRGPRQEMWLDRLEGELDNLRAALEWCLSESSRDHPGTVQESGEHGAPLPTGDCLLPSGPEMGLRLARALGWFWYHRGHWNEGRAWLERALKQTDCRDGELSPVRARALNLA